MSLVKNFLNVMEAAVAYVGAGFNVIPMYGIIDGKCQCGKADCRNAGKHPLIKWKDLSVVTVDTVKEWFTKWSSANIAVITGNGLLVVDIDAKSGGLESLALLEAKYGPLPKSVRVLTGGGGLHIYFIYNAMLHKIKSLTGLLKGVDIRADGGIIIAPPSNHISGKQYEWFDGKSIVDTPIEQAPEFLLNLIKGDSEKSNSANDASLSDTDKFHEGTRNDGIFKLAIQLRKNGLTGDALLIQVIEANNTMCVPPLDDGELTKIIESALSYDISVNDEHPYFSENGKMYMRTTKGVMQLSNFDIRLKEQRKIYDGGDSLPKTDLVLEVMSPKLDMKYVTIPSDKFEDSNYLISIDARLMVTAEKMRQHVSKAIRFLGNMFNVIRTHIYTGWTEINGKRMFLSNSGAIAEDGLNYNFKTDSEHGGPNGYELQLASDDFKINYSTLIFNLIRVADLKVTLPLLAAVFRAPLADMLPVDYSIGLIGKTGTKKTTLASLFLCFYGRNFSVTKTPENFNSTANAIQRHTFLHKDVLTLLDDYVVGETSEYVAEKIFRSLANRSARNRLTKDSFGLHTSFIPRGLLMFTAEDMNLGQSIRARIIQIDVDQKLTNDLLLTELQKRAKAGEFTVIMGEYIRWLAGNYDVIADEISALKFENQASQKYKGKHARTASNLSDLTLGMRYFLKFASEELNFDQAMIDHIELQAEDTFKELVKIQDEQNSDADPIETFLNCLKGSFATNIAFVETKINSTTKKYGKLLGYAEAFITGETIFQPKGQKVGLIKNDQMILIIEDAYSAAKQYARIRNIKFNITQYSLGRHLKDEGIIATESNRANIKRTIDGKRGRYWVIDNWEEVMFPNFDDEQVDFNEEVKNIMKKQFGAPIAPFFENGKSNKSQKDDLN